MPWLSPPTDRQAGQPVRCREPRTADTAESVLKSQALVSAEHEGLD